MENNETVIRNCVNSFVEGDLDRWVSLFTADATLEFPGSTEMSGIKLVKDVVPALKLFMSLFPNGLNLDIESIIQEGNRATCELRGKNNTLPNGKEYNNRYALIFEFEGGKIKKFREYSDTALVERVLVPLLSEGAAGENAPSVSH